MTASDALDRQLGPRERLLWSGRPRGGLRFRAADLLVVPFSLVWAGMAVFWEWSVASTDAPLIFKLWGIPFIAMGIYMVVGRFFWDAYQRSRTAYGVSDERVLIVREGLRARVMSLQLKTLGEVSLTVGRDGTGTIAFGAVRHPMARFAWSAGGGTELPVLEMVENAQSVYDLVREAERTAS